MKVFISWSGETSKAIADEIRKWLPSVLQAVTPYFSLDDVEKGTRWEGEISAELEASSAGIIVLTQDNIAAPWLLFEAGALAKNLQKSRVCPLLFDLEPTDVTGPLVQFQGAKFDKADFKRVIAMINEQLEDHALQAEVLDAVFEKWWPDLEAKIREILAKGGKAGTRSTRSDRDILEEILSLIRAMQPRRSSGVTYPPRAIDRLHSVYSRLLNEAEELGDGLPESVNGLIAAMKRPVDELWDAHQRFYGPLLGLASDNLASEIVARKLIANALSSQTAELENKGLLDILGAFQKDDDLPKKKDED